MGYNGVDLKYSISIGKIYSIHYFEYMSDFHFPGAIFHSKERCTISGNLYVWTKVR